MAETTETTLTTTSPIPPSKRRRRGLLLISALLLMTGLSVISYFAWQQITNSQQRLQEQIDALAHQLVTLQTDVQAMLSEDIPDEQMQEDIETQLKTFSAQQRRLETDLTTLANRVQQAPPRTEDWMLTETVYLLTLADYRLRFAKDFHTALVALLEAEHNLQSLPQTTLLTTVRNKLTPTISKVREATQLNLTELAAQLAHYATMVDQLPLLSGTHSVATETKTTTAVAKTVTTMDNTWQNLVATIWQQLQQLVVIRYNTQADTGLLSTQQQHFIVESLRFNLEMARYSLLHRDSQNFNLSLQTIADWLHTYYDQQQPTVKTWQQQLTAWQQLNLTPAMPNLSPIINTLQQALSPTSTHSPMDTSITQ